MLKVCEVIEGVEERDKRGWRGNSHLVKTRRLIARSLYHDQVHLLETPIA